MGECQGCCGCGGSDEFLSKVLTLTELTEYQVGTIVSRTLVEKPTGTVTVFAFDKGQKLSEHTAPYDAIVQVLDGDAEFTIAGKLQTAAKGQVLIMPANVPHTVAATKRFKMLLTMIRS